MKVLDAKFVQGFIRMCNDGWEQGWHERNGGNLTYRMKEQEAESGKRSFVRTGSGGKSEHVCRTWQVNTSWSPAAENISAM